MEESIMTILSVIVGGLITFLTSYLLENARIKNDKHKFTLEKIISVGEEFYRFSAYALIRFESLLDTYKTIQNYNSEQARSVLTNTDDNIQKLLLLISDDNITITSADIFYRISGVDKATSMINKIKASQAIVEEAIVQEAGIEAINSAVNLIKDVLEEYIQLIKLDRQKVKVEILRILESPQTANISNNTIAQALP